MSLDGGSHEPDIYLINIVWKTISRLFFTSTQYIQWIIDSYTGG